MSRNSIFGFVLLLVSNLVIGIMLIDKPVAPTPPANDGALGLVRPLFIDQARANPSTRAIANIADEAGLAAYGKTAAAITLNRARSAFTSIEIDTPDYLIGMITPTGYPAYWSAHVLVHKTGWVMAWYARDWLAAKIINVKDLNFTNSTKLSLALDIVTSKLSLTPIAPTYYHFKYPSATQLVIVRKSLSSGRSVTIQLPQEFTYVDVSAFYQANIGNIYDDPPSSHWLRCDDVISDNIAKRSLLLNGEVIIEQQQNDSAPADDKQYKDILAKINVSNTIKFGDSVVYKLYYDYTPPFLICAHSFAVAIVY